MNYLLIDFGASGIKSILYNSIKDTLDCPYELLSPFIDKTTITKIDLSSILDDIISKYKNVDKVLSCSILGGYYIEDKYYSWKEINRPQIPNNPQCLIGGLFNSNMHHHHAEALGLEGNSNITTLGYYQNIEFLSSLGDTQCALNSLKIEANDMVINLGTGSQVFYQNQKHIKIPSGRMFLIFEAFFKSLDKNFFKDLSTLTVEDLNNSTLHIDLNIFEQSYRFISGGFIGGILETNLTYHNLISSILREYINQYLEFIFTYNPNKVYLIGGIPKKLPIIKNYIKTQFPELEIIINSSPYLDTHLGMVNIIKAL